MLENIVRKKINIMMKRIAAMTVLAAAFVFMFLIMMCACSSKNGGKTVSLTTDEIAGEVLTSVKFPAMMDYTNQSEIEMYFGADFNNIKDITCKQQAISVNLAEIIIIKPKDGAMDAVMAFLRGRQDKFKNQSSYYPSQQLAAEATVVGSKYNVAYLICHDDAAAAEKALLNLLEKSLE